MCIRDRPNTAPEPTTVPTTAPEPTTVPTTAPEPTTVPTTTPEPTTALTTLPTFPVVDMANDTATIGKDFTFHCVVIHLDLLTEVRFSHGDKLIGSLNYTTNNSSVSTDGVYITGQKTGDVCEVNMTLSDVSCDDAGTYTCEAISDGHVDQVEAELRLTSKY